MKKIILVLTLAVAANNTQAQDDFRERVNFGGKIGFNLANVYDSDGEEFVADAKGGLAFGAFATLPIGKTLGIQPEILVSQKGFKSTGRLLGSTYTLTRTSTFIDVPILFAFRPTPYTSILLGPQYSYLTRQKDVFGNGTSSVMQQQEFNNDDIRKNILGVTGGIDINASNLVLGLRAGWDLQNNKGDGTSITPRYKNVWYQATIGYRFF